MLFCPSQEREITKENRWPQNININTLIDLLGIEISKNVPKRKCNNRFSVSSQQQLGGTEERVANTAFLTLPLFINNLSGEEPLRMLLPTENSTVHNNNTKKP